jgi:hypothetical protein
VSITVQLHVSGMCNCGIMNTVSLSKQILKSYLPLSHLNRIQTGHDEIVNERDLPAPFMDNINSVFANVAQYNRRGHVYEID